MDTSIMMLGGKSRVSIMKQLINFCMLVVCLFVVDGLFASNYKNISTDLNSGLLPVEAAKRAHKNNENSSEVVQQLVNNNVDVVKAVQTVVKEWGSCDDTYSSVKKGVQISPDRADEIVASVATIKGCHCNSQSFWGRSRIEQRLRPKINRALVEINDFCSCASAGIEAAIEVVPSKTEDMIDAIIVAKNRAENTSDSIGQIGKIPENKYWGDNSTKTKDSNLVRNTDVCEGDYNELDEFSPEATWASVNNAAQNSLSKQNSVLGQHKVSCKNKNVDKQENEKKNDALIISQYLEGQGNNQALELYNSSDKPIDLLLNNYQLEVYFHGYEFPGEVIQLKGLIEPQSTFVVSDANAAADIARASNQKVHGLVFKGADAVVLKSGFTNNPCACSVSTVASAINGIDTGNNSSTVVSKEKKDFIKRIEQHYENTNIQSTVIDSIGRILLNDENNNGQQDKPIVRDKTLRRVTNTCKGDRIEMDEFVLQKEWRSYAVDNFLDSGNFDEQECIATRKDLLLSEFVEGTKDNAMIEIFNGTDRPINFTNEKYFLEIYNDDDEDPEKRIYLKGNVDRKGTFVISNDSAERSLKNVANQTSAELDLENARAVVLKKVVLPAYQSCYADINTWLVNNKGDGIIYISKPINDPGSGPISIDDPRDGDDGGQFASPN